MYCTPCFRLLYSNNVFYFAPVNFTYTEGARKSSHPPPIKEKIKSVDIESYHRDLQKKK